MKTEVNLGRGLFWTGLEKVLVYGVNFVQGVILARILNPESFGLAAMLGIFILVGGILAESGLTAALIVKGRGIGVRTLERRVLLWNILVALVIYLAFALAAPWIALWYGHPILAPLMWLMALGLVINAASTVATARLWRNTRFSQLAWVNSGGTIVAAVIAVLMARYGCGVWSIAGLGVSHAIARTAFAWLAARSCRDRDVAYEYTKPSATFRELVEYGVKLTLSGIIGTLYIESYNLIIGKVLSPVAVGLFARSDRWARLSGEVSGDIIGRVALPALTRPEGVRPSEAIRFVFINVALIWPGIVVLLVWTPQIVSFVLGEQWIACVPYLRILLLGQMLAPVSNVSQHILKGSGRADIVLKTDIWKKPFGFAALGCALPLGMLGFCWARIFGDVVAAVVDAVYAVRYGRWNCSTKGN